MIIKALDGKDFKTFAPNSSKKVLVRCDRCKKQRETTFQTATMIGTKTHCRSCARTLSSHKRPQSTKGVSKPNILGSKHYRWKGGRSVTKDGYIKLYNKSDPKGYSLEHVVVIEQTLGRKVQADELVHHIDGDKKNNDINNLVLLTSHTQHKNAHNSLQKIGYDLVRQGIIVFDRIKNEYILKCSSRPAN